MGLKVHPKRTYTTTKQRRNGICTELEFHKIHTKKTCNYDRSVLSFKDIHTLLSTTFPHLHAARFQHLLHVCWGRSDVAASERLQRRQNLVESLVSAAEGGGDGTTCRGRAGEEPSCTESSHLEWRPPSRHTRYLSGV